MIPGDGDSYAAEKKMKMAHLTLWHFSEPLNNVHKLMSKGIHLIGPRLGHVQSSAIGLSGNAPVICILSFFFYEYL